MTSVTKLAVCIFSAGLIRCYILRGNILSTRHYELWVSREFRAIHERSKGKGSGMDETGKRESTGQRSVSHP